MKNLLKLEETGLFLVGIYFALSINSNIILLIVALFLPDAGMIGYLVNPKIGSYTYNLTHHKGIAAILIVAGMALNKPALVYVGSIMLAHSSGDRMLGIGLKHPDSFQNTHLGKIGKQK